LGYIAANRSVHRERSYGAADDLKTLLPLQNKMLQGVNLYQMGKIAEGERLLREVIAASPTFSLAYNHLAAMMLETKGWREAVAVLADGLSKNPGDISIMAKMGIIIAENGDARRAIQLLSACLRNGNTDADVFNYLGIAHYRNQEWPEALASYRQALALAKNNAPVYNNMGSLYLSRFLQNNDQESFRLAVQNFRAALAIDPKLYAAYNGLGAAFKKMKRTQEAIDCWHQALAIKPDYPFALINLGIALLESGDARGALRYLYEYRDKYSSKLPAAERRSVERLILEAENKIEK
jgi:Flp pilus assembly protein TadD